MGTLKEERPDLAAEWDYEKNGDITPDQIKARSTDKYWWRCKNGHPSWKTAPVTRLMHGCPYCSGRRAIAGVTDLATVCPEIAAEWDYEKNGDITPDQVKPSSSTKFWWRCKNGHPSWEAAPSTRKKHGCPYCSGRRPIVGVNDFATLHPDLVQEWDYERNGDTTPDQIKSKSNTKYWWRCKNGHPSWEATPNVRSRHGCPYCSGRKPITGTNDFATLHPDLLTEWDYEKNGTLTPNQIGQYSNKKVHWKCSKGHCWEATVCGRSFLGHGCPYCFGRFPVSGENDLATRFPDIAAQWHPTLNGNLRPNDIMPGSQKKIWWQCDQGHPPWKTTACNRISHGTGCPYCSGDRLLQGVNDLATVRPDLAAEWCYNLNGDITPEMVLRGSNTKYWWQCKNGHPPWETAVNNRATHGTGCPYCAREYLIPGVNDLATVRPDLAAEWCYELNGDVTPKMVLRESSIKYWWQCKNGHPPWKTSISHRVHGSECPYCVGRKAIPGVNDLATLRPELAAEWCYELNSPLTPDKTALHAGKYVWWQCSKGHPPWKSCVNTRAKGYGCPYCAGQRVLPGVNDLATLRPDLVPEWDYEANGTLLPNNVTGCSNLKVSWKCTQGHPSWTATIYSRTRDTRCPYCAGKRPIIGVNDLATLRPDLAAEWDYDRNGDMTPEKVLPYSDKKYWWKCGNNHPSWLARTCNRAIGHNCPYCSGRIPVQGVNDLATLRPDIAAEWDYENNKDLSPSMFTVFSHKIVYWVCSNGHPPWKTTIGSRSNGSGCPYCAGFYPIPGVNDLAALRPDLVTGWDYERNKNLKPSMFTVSSTRKVWWTCEHGHPSWKTSIASRSNGSGCPYCAERLPIVGANDLATLRPELVAEWDFEKNGNLSPSTFTLSSNKKIFWRCAYGHPAWEATITSRSRGAGCPYCAGRLPIPGINDLATQRPELADEWDYEKNKKLSPSMFPVFSSRKVWWTCKYGHPSWEASIASRSDGSGCPHCAEHIPISGANDLATLRPDLVAEWDFEKNGNLTPSMVTVSSSKKVFWKCSEEHHSWNASVASRSNGSSCPFCAGIIPISGVNDLATLRPDLAAQWDFDENGDSLPSMFTVFSSIKVRWRCEKGHSWRTSISSRSNGSGCPYCKGFRKLPYPVTKKDPEATDNKDSRKDEQSK